MGLALAVLGAAVAFVAPPLPPELAQPKRVLSRQLTDREGRPLREVLSSAAGVSRWVPLEEISPFLVRATLASEDRRFYLHPGLDPVACLRAFRSNWRAGHVVEGGSTLTQQLVRNLRPGSSRDLRGKLAEAYWATRLELASSKRAILEAYLNRVPYGQQCYGAEAAAQHYFARPARELSLAQAAMLAVLPRSPESFAPYQDLEDVQVYQRRLLDAMLAGGYVDEESYRLACAEPLQLAAPREDFRAGHFCDWVLSRAPAGEGELRTTLDLRLQEEAEKILATHVRRLADQGVSNGALVVLDAEGGEVLAMAGSIDYRGPQGQFNAALALRQPGSTLKPFTYGLALEQGWTAASLLPDLDIFPRDVTAGFIPDNYDRTFHGPVRMRTALACSYNVPAVRLVEEVGVEALLTRLRHLGFSALTAPPAHYGVGLTLGDGEVTLLELASAYRVLARGGRYAPARNVLDSPAGASVPVMDARVAYILTHMLADNDARIPAFGRFGPLALPFACASKTGTSKDFRDNWTVGFTSRYVVAVWVGNFDNSSMREVSGITGAGPIFRELMLALERRDGGAPAFATPQGLLWERVCVDSGELAGDDCAHTMREVFLADRKGPRKCSVHRRIDGKLYAVYPPLYRSWMAEQGLPMPPARAGSAEAVRIAFPDQGAAFRLDPVLRPEYQRVRLRGAVPDDVERVSWFIDQQEVSTQAPFDAWWTMQRGQHRLQLIAYDGQGKEVGRSRNQWFVVR